MKCPACAQEMNHRDRHGTEIDVCSKCRGVWLDITELDSILGVDDTKSVEAGLDDSARLPEQCRYCGDDTGPDGECPSCDRSVALRCPHDDKLMYVVDAAGIELDRCPECKGLWVDGFERQRLGKMRKELMERAVQVQNTDSGSMAAALIGMGTVGETGDGDGMDSFFGLGNSAPDDSSEAASDASGDSSTDKADPKEARGQGDVKNVREYFDKHGGFELECSQCSAEVSRYTSWENEGVIYCLSCGEDLMPGTIARAMKYKEPPTFSESLEDEEHLLEVLGWLVGSIFRWRR